MTEAALPSGKTPDATRRGETRWPTQEDISRIAAVSDPVVRNLQITQAYHDLSVAMAHLTGEGANWCTVATWASKQAGQSIRREDLVVALKRLLSETHEAEASAAAWLEAGAEVSQYRPRSLGGALEVLWEAIDPAAAFQRTSDAVARGNRKVFEEIGAEFARFIDDCAGSPPSDDRLGTFLAALTPGEAPYGQRYLRRAFAHYAQAMRAAEPKARAQLLLLANLEIGFHEQTRLQPEIVEAMNAPVVNPKYLRRRLVDELFPNPGSRIRYWLGRVTKRMERLLQARDRLAEETQRLGRLAVTANLMTLSLPGQGVVRLGRNLPDSFPDPLAVADQPELVELLQVVDLTPNDLAGTGVVDWADLPQRMHFIADLFRTYHFTAALFDAPFAAAQVAEIRAGRRPPGPL